MQCAKRVAQGGRVITRAYAAVLPAAEAAFSIEPVELQGPRKGEILVRIEASGICHTDVDARRLVPVPSVLGHEGVGYVEALGEGVDDLAVGDRVVLSYPACERCPNCRGGRRSRCPQHPSLAFAGHRADGSRPVAWRGVPVASAFFQQSSFATHAIAVAGNAIKVDSGLPAALLAALPCGVITGAGAVLHVLAVREGERVLVCGAGAVGLAAVMAARIGGASRIVVLDRHPARCALARELGATDTVGGERGALERCVAEAGGGVHLALDTTGSASVMRRMFGVLEAGGRCGIVTEPPPGSDEAGLLAALFARAATLHSVYMGDAVPRAFIPQLLRWHAEGRFPVDRMVHTFALADINAAFAAAADGRVVKPVLLMP